MPNPYLQANQYRTYDGFEAQTGAYGISSRKLIRAMLPMVERRAARLVYDAGCGTGNSMLQALRAFGHAQVVGIDASDGMLRYAMMKLGMEPADGLIRELIMGGDTGLALFLLEFREKAAKLAGRAGLMKADLMEFNGNPADAIVGSHILHWLRPQEDVPARFAKMLRKGGVVGFSSSMSFYKPIHHKPEGTALHYHPFVLHCFDALSRLIGKETGKTVHAPELKEKKHPHETVALFESNGFAAVRYEEFLLPRLPPEVLLGYNLKVVPAHLGMFEGTGLDGEAQGRLAAEAIAETLCRHSNLLTPEGVPLDTNPMFIFMKK